IRNSATTVQNVVTYDAVIDVDNSDLRLRPGMTANVTVIYAERKDALAVSNAALRFRGPPSAAGSAGASPSGSGRGHHGPPGAASAPPAPPLPIPTRPRARPCGFCAAARRPRSPSTRD